VRAALPFFIADGIFNWNNAKIDDGSSYEMGQLAHVQNASGYNLPADSPWRMDLPTIMAIITYQTDSTLVATPWIVNPYAASGHEINQTDKAYFSGSGGGGGGGGGPIAPGY
jgi:hypothetical protein